MIFFQKRGDAPRKVRLHEVYGLGYLEARKDLVSRSTMHVLELQGSASNGQHTY